MITTPSNLGVAIGLQQGDCSTPINYNTFFNCCSVPEDYCQDLYYTTDKLGLYAFGANNVSVREEWITPAIEHYPTDIGLMVDNFNTTNRRFAVSVPLSFI